MNPCFLSGRRGALARLYSHSIGPCRFSFWSLRLCAFGSFSLRFLFFPVTKFYDATSFFFLRFFLGRSPPSVPTPVLDLSPSCSVDLFLWLEIVFH